MPPSLYPISPHLFHFSIRYIHFLRPIRPIRFLRSIRFPLHFYSIYSFYSFYKKNEGAAVLPVTPLLGGGYLLSHFRSTIGVVRLNFSVRNGKRWDPHAITT